MSVPKVKLTIAKVLLLDAPPLVGEDSDFLPVPPCNLKWRRDWLYVSPAKLEAETLPALGNEKWFKECLERSPVQAVCLSPNLDEAALKLWADRCQEVGKLVYLRLPSQVYLPHRRYPWKWSIKRVLDWCVAFLLLLILSPVLLVLAIVIRLDSPGSIFLRQWRVGKRGKLFQILKFRSMVDGANKLQHPIMVDQVGLHRREDDPRITSIGRWMRKYSLDELPQLFNVLRGEMSLVGPYPCPLYDAIRTPLHYQSRLNALPGITRVWQFERRSHSLDLETITQLEFEYLRNWSIGRDLKILLTTISRVISGFGTY